MRVKMIHIPPASLESAEQNRPHCLPTDWKAPITDLNNWPRLVQLAWSHCDSSGNILSESDYIIKPQGFIIPEDAAKVHGISTENPLIVKLKESMVKTNGISNDYSSPKRVRNTWNERIPNGHARVIDNACKSITNL